MAVTATCISHGEVNIKYGTETPLTIPLSSAAMACAWHMTSRILFSPMGALFYTALRSILILVVCRAFVRCTLGDPDPYPLTLRTPAMEHPIAGGSAFADCCNGFDKCCNECGADKDADRCFNHEDGYQHCRQRILRSDSAAVLLMPKAIAGGLKEDAEGISRKQLGLPCSPPLFPA